MLSFHGLLDKLFKKQISFSVFFRIWLSFVLLIVLAFGLAFYHTQKTLRPSAKRVVEDSLADTSRLLSSLMAQDVANFGTSVDFADKVNERLQNTFGDDSQSLLWYDKKDKSQLHLYITDKAGKVIYDSRGESLGADFSRWNDVYLTLQGRYGARSSDRNGHSVMYVASPMMYQGKLVGVLSVGKPTLTLAPYLDKSRDELIEIILSILALVLATSVLIAWWLRHSIYLVNRYTKTLASTPPPYFYLGKELNELTANIDQMKHVIENRAYVTEYVHTLTHELKSPLTAIKASGELLAEDLTPSERAQFSGIIAEQSGKLTGLVNTLLTLAKIEQPNFKLSLGRVPVSDIIATCLNQQLANIKKLGRVVACVPSDVVVWADTFWLGQALQNVIDNAIYYGVSGVFVGANDVGDAVNIYVINDSPILPDYVCLKAFDRYFSVGSGQAGEHKGTGLGLTLVKQIIGLHGGTVSFSQIDKEALIKSYPHCRLQGENFVVVEIVLSKII